MARRPHVTGSDRGYAIHELVVGRAVVERVIDGLDTAALDRTRAGARHVLGVPAVRAIAADPRMLAIAGTFLRAAPVAFRATLFDKSPAANWLVAWHQDTALPLRERNADPAWGPWSTKAGVLYAHAPARALEQIVALRLSLDDSTVANGPLRVLPGTHRLGVLADADIERLAREVPPVECLAAAGGVVAIRPLTIHSSSKATGVQARRVLHVEYAAAMSLGPGVELAVG